MTASWHITMHLFTLPLREKFMKRSGSYRSPRILTGLLCH